MVFGDPVPVIDANDPQNESLSSVFYGAKSNYPLPSSIIYVDRYTFRFTDGTGVNNLETGLQNYATMINELKPYSLAVCQKMREPTATYDILQ